MCSGFLSTFGMTGSYLFLGGGRRWLRRRLPPPLSNRLKALSFGA